MRLLLALSIIINLCAIAWTAVLFRQLRDWRISLGSAAFCAVTVRQLYVLRTATPDTPLSQALLASDGTGLVVSVFAILALLYFGGMLTRLAEGKEELVASAAKNRALLRAIPDMVFEVDKDGVYHDFIPAKDIDPIRPPSEFLGKTITETLPPDTAAAMMSAIEAAFRTQESQKLEVPLDRGDGKTHVYEVRVEPTSADRCIYLVRDITVAKQAEEEKEEQRQLMDAILRHLPLVAVRIDENGVFQESVGAGLARLGLKDNEAVGISVLDAYPQIKDEIEQALGGESVEYETHGVGPAGPWWGRSYLAFDSVRGKGAIGCGFDVTEQHLANEALRLQSQAVEASQNGIMMVEADDGKLSIVYVNPAFERITGYTSEEVIGKNPRFLRKDDNDQPDLERLRTALREKREASVVLRNYRKDGTIFWNELRVSPVRNEQGDVTHFVGVQNDITERRELQEKMQHAQKLESLGVLAGGIAHDFNNLLLGILGNADLAQSELSPTSPGRQYMSPIISSAERAADLCSQLLAYSGRGKFVVQPIDLSDVAREMAHLLELSISKSATLQLDLGEDLPAIEADPTQIRQVVMNLITNASDAIGEKPGVIRLHTGSMSCDTDYLEGAYSSDLIEAGTYAFVEVVDSGQGMDEETRRQIFDPFFTTKATGRGLGLAACLGIVRGHRGAITLSSQPGEGTTFRVLFPASDREAVSSVRSAEGPALERGSGLILLVDDEPAVRKLGRNILERAGFDVLTACDGREGLQVFKENADVVRAVILDMTMPEMSGDEVLHEIHKIGTSVPVILSSGYSQAETTDRVVGEGLAGFIQKPYRPNDLVELIRQVIE